MGIARRLLLWGADQAWLREQARRRRFVRRAVSRFIPGEDAEAAIEAAEGFRERGMGTILTQLGENVEGAPEAEAVTRHYLSVLDRLDEAGLDTPISVKLTQLGQDLSQELAFDQLAVLIERARTREQFVWLDMESSRYVDGTLDIYERARASYPRVGVAVQGYLRRSGDDLDRLIPLGAHVRLVKGAYNEPASVAYPRKADVDESFARLASRFFAEPARAAGASLAIGSHDVPLIDRIYREAEQGGAGVADCEIQMIYGIARAAQLRYAQAGRRVRVLISYGDAWFPWYMRRLAERPANVGFVVRSLFSR